MAGLIIVVAVAGCLMAFLTRPILALAVYSAAMFLLPAEATVKLGTLNFTPARFIVIALLANAVFRAKLMRRFRWEWMDTLALAVFLSGTLAFMLNEELYGVLQYQGGIFFDTFLAYLAVRLIIRTRRDVVRFIWHMVIIATPLAAIGMYESLSGVNLYVPFSPVYATPHDVRHGLNRAFGPFGVHILFGLYFAALAPLSLILWRRGIKGKLAALFGLGTISVGMISTMSSGPLYAYVITMMIMAFFRLRRYWIVPAVAGVIAMAFVEMYSDSHFYNVLGGFAFKSYNATYRIELIEEAFSGGMTGHWFSGYGMVSWMNPGHNGFNWEHNDLTNIYIQKLAQTGLLGTLPFLLLNILLYRRLYVAARYARKESNAWIIWVLAAVLIGWNNALLTVSAFRQIETMLYMLIALAANMPAVMQRAGAVQQPARGPRRRFRASVLQPALGGGATHA